MRDNCRICGRAERQEIFSHPNTPLFVGILGPDTPKNLSNINLPISLVRCRECDTIQQPIEPKVDALLDQIYMASHDNACSGTRTGEGEFGRRRAQQFLDGVDLNKMPADILEIGCNQGHMLAICKERGGRNLVGVEPSVDEAFSPQTDVTILPGYFTRDIVGGSTFDLAYMIEVLEHIPTPTNLLKDVHQVLKPGGKIAISVPNCESGLEFGNIGMPIHEHLIYFTPQTLSETLRRAGFKVRHINGTFSHLYCLAERVDDVAEAGKPESVAFEKFWPAAQSKFKIVQQFADSQSGAWGLYGACSLTANLLAWHPYIDLDNAYVIDADHNKWGKVVSGCPKKTISPEDAVAAGVRNVVVMPFGFQENIETFIRERYPELEPTLLFRGLADQYAARTAH